MSTLTDTRNIGEISADISDILNTGKNRGVGWLEIENKLKKNKKNNIRDLLEVSGCCA